MKSTSLSFLRCVLFLVLPVASIQANDTKHTKAELRQLVDAANEVLSDGDNVRAGKHASAVFEAAHALDEVGESKAAMEFMTRALQLSPWRLIEQLTFAKMLKALGRTAEANDAARMVQQRAESDALYQRACELLEMKPEAPVPAPEREALQRPWICFVKIGSVNDIVLTASAKKLEATLGVPVRLLDESVQIGPPHRSAYKRWVTTQLVPRINWNTRDGDAMLRQLNASSPDKIDPNALVQMMTNLLKSGGRGDEAAMLQETATFMRDNDKQWDASKLVTYAPRVAGDAPNFSSAILVGITEGDLYSDDSNYVFGTALNNKAILLSSYARFRAEFGQEPEDRARLVSRMHKLLLSSVGNSLGVPRPTDPTSARAYPASLPEHDAKSEYMSEACIEGFEKALKKKLPKEAHKPTATSSP